MIDGKGHMWLMATTPVDRRDLDPPALRPQPHPLKLVPMYFLRQVTQINKRTACAGEEPPSHLVRVAGGGESKDGK